MSFGQYRYKEINKLLNQKFKEKGVLVVCHRGAWGGNVIENTTLAFDLCLDMGTDMLECDVAKSTDGVLYAIHDGYEERFFGFKRNIEKLSSDEINALEYRNSISKPSGVKVQKLKEILDHYQNGELFNLDRTWKKLPETLTLLDKYPDVIKQVLIKSPLRKNVLEILNEHPRKYMYMPIVYNMDEIEEALSYPNLNMVGVELIAHTPEHEFFQDSTIEKLKRKGLFIWANAINLSPDKKHILFGGLDDADGLAGGLGWQTLMEKGIDVIQTDWPYQLSLVRDNYVNKLK